MDSDFIKLQKGEKVDLKNFSLSDNLEQALLSVLINSENSDLFCRVHDELQPADFLNSFHKKIYEYLINLVIVKNSKIDKNLIYNSIKSANLKKYFEILLSTVGNIENIDQYVSEIKKSSKLFRIKNISTDLQYVLAAEEPDPDSIINDIEEKLIKITISSSVDFESPKDIVASVLEEIRSGGVKYDLSTSIPDLDAMIGGIPPEYMIIGARPSMGKTETVLQMAIHNARNGIRVAIFSLEMNGKSLMYRVLAQMAKIELQKLKKGELNARELAKLEECAAELETLPLHINALGGVTASTIVKKTNRLKIKHPDLKLVIIDYIGLIQYSSDNENVGLGKVSKMLKNMSQSLDIAVIALTQLSRKVEDRENKRPQLSDIRSSGDIEQDADLVIFLYSDDYYNGNRDAEVSIIEFILGKNRNGPTGTIYANNIKTMQIIAPI